MTTAFPVAPEFPDGLVWLNTDRPLRFSEALRGRVVVLDFWTYCCINCMHVLPDLKYLEEKYAHEPVVFIGVHSNKYDNEADPEHVRQAVMRHTITHPVVVDNQHQVWGAFGVRAWPSLVLIDSTGHAVAAFSGEGHRDELDHLIAALLDIGRKQDTLADTPLEFRAERYQEQALAFPGKILADGHGKRLFIADTNHNRILITDWQGGVRGFLGSGGKGLMDGSYEDVRFQHPQGMALSGNNLFIADTENHAVRHADLTTYHVHTVLGNGMIGYDRRGGHRGREQLLNSPWDLAFHHGKLYIAMAGLHQLWVYDPVSEIARVAAGTGREDITDNPAQRAALAQPSGITASEGQLYFADAETSAIRVYDPTANRVETLVGKGLFVFGDEDGSLEEARLQHPLGVAYHDNAVYVADSYNHRIRRIDLRDGTVRTIMGTGAAGRREGDRPALYEPGGISIAKNVLFVADTNNHRILEYDLTNGKWRELTITLGGTPLAEAA
jgi:thiol-disulfide isomerase/thioredoxin